MPPAHADAQALVGKLLCDRFRVVQILGTGGVGHVYLAERVTRADGAPPARVAVKVLRAEHRNNPAIVARFEREAAAAARVRHSSVLRVEGLERDGGVPWFAMELLVGLDLADTLASARTLLPSRAARIAADVAAGLDAAHRADIIHRDVKPENIFLVHAADGREVVKLLDFGVSFLRGEDGAGVAFHLGAGSAGVAPGIGAGSAGSAPGIGAGSAGFAPGFDFDPPGARQIVGTPEYMAPEQAQGATPEPAADIYALGIVLYEMLAGRVPFTGPYPSIMHQHEREPPPPLHRLHPGLRISRDLDAVVRRALVKDPRGRFATAADLRAALLDAPEGRGSASRPDAGGLGVKP